MAHIDWTGAHCYLSFGAKRKGLLAWISHVQEICAAVRIICSTIATARGTHP
jgi:hypothetical protein